MSDVLRGFALGITFNPALAVSGAALAAALSGYPGARGRIPLSAAAVLGAWLLGDGLRVIGWLRDALAAAPRDPHLMATVVVWAGVGLTGGYAAPAVLGSYVGRRVRFGTGWLAAASVAASTALALNVLGSSFSGASAVP